MTAGLGVEKKRSLTRWTIYSAIMFKSLADRLAEAFAECLHHRVRTDLWGYAAGEQLSNDDMIAEVPRHPPRPGYPACPDHSAKTDLFRVLNAGRNRHGPDRKPGPRRPAASVSGFHQPPDAVYFNVGKIGETSCTIWPSAGAWMKVLERLLARICDAMNWIAAGA